MPSAKALFNTYHLTAAAHNARIAGKAEEAHEKQGPDGSFRNEPLRRWQVIHDSHIILSFVASYAAVEATINESLDSDSELYWNYSEEIDQLKAAYPGDFVRDESTGAKYQLLLMHLEKEPFDSGVEPYQSVEILRKLRNFFIHHDPIWGEGTPDDPEHPLGKALKTKDFELNPFRPDEPFFPSRCISYGCAKWAFLSALEFINEFYDRIGIRPPYAGWEDRLKTELQTDWIEQEPNW